MRKQLETLDARVKETAVKTLNVMVEKGPDFADIVRTMTVLSLVCPSVSSLWASAV